MAITATATATATDRWSVSRAEVDDGTLGVLRGSNTGCSLYPWKQMQSRMKKARGHRRSLMVTGCFDGLRIAQLLTSFYRQSVTAAE